MTLSRQIFSLIFPFVSPNSISHMKTVHCVHIVGIYIYTHTRYLTIVRNDLMQLFNVRLSFINTHIGIQVTVMYILYIYMIFYIYIYVE